MGSFLESSAIAFECCSRIRVLISLQRGGFSRTVFCRFLRVGTY
jgi:hypothetical protein